MSGKRPHEDRPEGLSHNPFRALRPDGDAAPPAERAEAPAAAGAADARGGRLVVRREKRGRAGKTVTRVSGVVGDADALEQLARELKRALGCGATVEDGTVVLQGAQTERAAAWLRAERGADVAIGN